ncbi:MAG: GNAT family protein [Pseudomonadota bacterium]
MIAIPTSWTPGALLKLETERFVLRTMTREDVDDSVVAWLANPEVMVGLNLPRRRMTRAQAVRWALSYDNATKFMVLVCAKDSGEKIGFFTLTIEGAHRTAETAVVVGAQHWWGKNVVAECRAVLMDFLFDTLNMHKVIGRPHGRNMSSIFNYKKMGFTCEAVLRQQMRAIDSGEGEDKRLDQLIFGMLRTEWHARKAGEAA